MERLHVSPVCCAALRDAVQRLSGLLQGGQFGPFEIRVEGAGPDDLTGLVVSSGQVVVLPASHLASLDYQSLVVAVPRRLQPRPVLASAPEHADRLARELRRDPSAYDPRDLFAGLPQGSRIAVSGLSDETFARWLRPDVEVECFETRADDVFARLRESSLDAMIADESELQGEVLPACPHRFLQEPWLSEPGQGASIVVASREDEELTVLLKALEHRNSRIEIESEIRLQNICRMESLHVLRARARCEGDRLGLRAVLLAVDLSWTVEAQRQGEVTRSGASRLARRVARDLSDQLTQSEMPRE